MNPQKDLACDKRIAAPRYRSGSARRRCDLNASRSIPAPYKVDPRFSAFAQKIGVMPKVGPKP